MATSPAKFAVFFKYDNGHHIRHFWAVPYFPNSNMYDTHYKILFFLDEPKLNHPKKYFELDYMDYFGKFCKREEPSIQDIVKLRLFYENRS